jgi:hypothetical protein
MIIAIRRISAKHNLNIHMCCIFLRLEDYRRAMVVLIPSPMVEGVYGGDELKEIIIRMCNTSV